MENLNIVIQTLEDSKKEISAIPELKGKTFHKVNGMTVCIMEDMTNKNKCGISFVLENSDGTYSSHLVTENLMNGLISAYKGALQRFEMLKAKRN